MEEREVIYEQVGNYTKYKVIEMLINKHQDSFKSLNHIEKVTDDILEILSMCGLKFYSELKGKFKDETK